MFKDYYKILGVSYNATFVEIKSAYRIMSKKWHPDKNPDIDVTNIMQDINEAYAILKDYTKRQRYDIEYSKFSATSHVQQNKQNTWDYDYNVQDENVRDDINSARAYAKDIVDEFFSSLKTISKVAVHGAWNGMQAYVVVGLVLFIVGCIISVFIWSDNKSIDYGAEFNSYQSVPSVEVQASQLVTTLDSVFETPQLWTNYLVNNAFSISVPATVELRHEYDAYTKKLSNLNLIRNTDAVIFQQKGLSKAPANADAHYCRIIIQYRKGNAGDYLHSNEIEIIDAEIIAIFRSLVVEQLATQRLLAEPNYTWIDINGIKAIEIKYRRSGNDKNTTACTMYLLFNYEEYVQIIVSYREQEANVWLPDLNNVIKTFKWNNQQ